MGSIKCLLGTKRALLRVLLALLCCTGYAAASLGKDASTTGTEDATATTRLHELPAIPDNLPAPADMPILLKNRFVDANKAYDLWPKDKKNAAVPMDGGEG